MQVIPFTREPGLRRTSKYRPCAFRCAGNVGDAREGDESVRLIEVGVIHGHVGGVRAALVNGGVAAVAKVRPCPRAVRLHEFRAVVLRAADGEVGVRRVQ